MGHDSLLHEWLRSQAHVSLKISADLEEAAEKSKNINAWQAARGVLRLADHEKRSRRCHLLCPGVKTHGNVSLIANIRVYKEEENENSRLCLLR